MGKDGFNVVLGAGPVGRALVDELRRRGQPVRLVTRRAVDGLPDDVQQARADVTDAGLLGKVCEGAAVVYGCVGLDYTGWPERWPPMMEGMLSGAQAVGARFVFLDNLYMYGPTDGVVTATLPLTSYGRKPATRARITRMWQAAHTAGRVQAVAVRASDFYGPGVTRAALGERSFGRIVAGRPAQCLGDVDQLHSFSYVPDVARALATLGAAPDDAMGQAWHVPNAPDRTVRALLRQFADVVGRPLRVSVVPGLLLALGGLASAELRELREMRYLWDRPFRVDASKFGARFWADATPFEAGIAATAAWYRGAAADRTGGP